MTHYEATQMVYGKTKRTSRKVGNNTYAHISTDGSVCIILHGTCVVRIHPDNSATLNTGGWYTSTTKDRINKYSPVRVYQCKGEWYLNNDDNTPYEDGMTVADMNLIY